MTKIKLCVIIAISFVVCWSITAAQKRIQDLPVPENKTVECKCGIDCDCCADFDFKKKK